MAKKKKSYNLILYELQKEALNNAKITGGKVASNSELEKIAQEEYLAPIRDVNLGRKAAEATDRKKKQEIITKAKENTKKTTSSSKTKKSIKTPETFSQKAGHVAKSFGSGILSGVSGLFEAGTTEIANNLNKGQDDDYNLMDSIFYLLNPTIGMQKTFTESILDSAKTIGDKEKTPLQKAASVVNNATTAALEMIPGKGILDQTTQIIGHYSPDNAGDAVMEASNKVTQPVYDLQEDLYYEGQQYGGATQFLGETSSVVGRMIPSALTTLVTKNPQLGMGVMATSVKGSSTTEALKKGAELDEAVKTGNTKGMIEYGTELLFGGVNIFGKGALDDIIEKGIDRKVKNEVLNYIAQKGIGGIGGELVEETISDVLNVAVDKGTVDPNASYSFKDWGEMAPITILSTLVINALTGGYGSASFKDNAARMKQNQAEGIQQEIAKKTEELNQSQDVREKQIIQETINGLNEELNELTNVQTITDEKELRKQNFTYQAQENDSDIKKAVYESASKVMNNTTTTHKFVDVVAKIADEKGTVYKFTNNEQLKQLGYAKEGMTINGLVNENGEVLINIDSAKMINTVVGHETTHLLEGTKEYEALKQVAIEYAKSKGDYDARIETLTKLYEGTNADIEAELTSDIVGEYLFTDENFVKELSVKQPTVFEKIRNFIDDLIVRFKGTDQEKQLRQLQRTFEKAYKAQGTQTSTDTKYSFLGEVITQDNPQAQMALDTAKEMYAEKKDMDYIRQNTGWFKATDGNWKAEVDDSNAELIKKPEKNKTYRLGDILKHDDLYSFIPEYKNLKVITTDMEAYGSFNPKTGLLKLNNNIINNKTLVESTMLHELQHATQTVEGWKDGTNLKNAGSWEAYENNHGEREAREVQARRKMSFEDRMRKAPSTQSKVQYSISESTTDNQGRTLTKEQQEYFKDSKVRDENGNLLEMYHKTETDFNVFDKSKIGKTGSWFGKGFYFTPSMDYFENGDIKGNVIKKVYLNLKNPLQLTNDFTKLLDNKQIDNIVNEISEEKLKDIKEYYFYRYGITKEDTDTQVREKIANYLNNLETDAEVLNTLTPTFFNIKEFSKKFTKATGYDGVINPIKTEYIAFEPNQIKNVDNTNPTTDPDIRYSLSEDTQGRKLSEEQKEYFKNVIPELKDENGNLKVLYHGTPNEFTQFNYDFIGTNGTALGKGFYLTDDRTVAEGYGNVMEVYANITKPMLFEDRSMTKAEYKKFVEAVDKATEGQFLSDYGEVDYEGYRTVLNRALQDYEYGGDDIDLVHGVLNTAGLTWEQGFRILKDTIGYDGVVSKKGFLSKEGTVYIPTLPEQIKSINNTTPTDNPDINLSLSAQGEEIAPTGQWNVRGEDIKLQVEEAIAPLQETISNLTEQVKTMQESFAPTSQDIVEKQGQENFAHLPESEMPTEINGEELAPIEDTYEDVSSPVQERDIDEVGNRKVKAYQYEHPEVRPYFQVEADNMLGELERRIEGERFAITDQEGYITEWAGVSRQIPEFAEYLKDNYNYTYEQIEKGLKAIIEDNGAENNAVSKRLEILLDERLTNGYVDFLEGYPIPPNQEYKNMLIENDAADYYSNLAKTLDDAEIPVENAQIEATTKDIPMYEKIEPLESPTTRENAVSQQTTSMKAKTAQNGNTELTDTSIETQRQERAAKIMAEAPTPQKRNQRLWAKAVMNFVDKGAVFENLSLKTKNRELMGKWDSMLTSAGKAQNTMLNGIRKIDAKNNVEEQVSKSLDDIRTKVVNSGKVQEFYEYMYHALNVDRMSLEKNAQAKAQQMLEENPILKELNRRNTIANIEARLEKDTTQVTLDEILNEELLKKNNDIFKSKEIRKEEAEYLFDKVRELIKLNKTKNKPVFGDSVTAEASQKAVKEFEMANPEFAEWANDVYQYNNALRDLMVENNIISQETADLFAEMYPHYVPIKRIDTKGNAINVPLDTNRTSVNTPIKRAKGGSQDILPMFDTMAGRTLQTYKAISKNNFGIELKNTLNSTVDNQQTNLDEILDNVDQQENLLQEGKDGQAPTFTVFEKGNKVTYEITQDMYDALKPISDSSWLSTTIKPANFISNFHRGVLTEYNPVFMLTNAIKDFQDILMNSQHAAKTYAKLGESYVQILKKGMWYREYMANGGDQNSYFDSQDNTYGKESIADKILPLKAISKLNNIIELSPRLAEYIASRESGRSVEVSMLDAARVTTNFKAGGDVTKWANRNGATFLNASMQGVAQQVRNVREAHANGLKGYANLATKFALAGLPAMILNGLLWEDDEDYEELSDYVKTNYWIVGKYGDGNFIRIPKGRMITVIQESFNQIKHLITGDEQADLNSFLEVLGNNIAPNNPVSDNILSPIVQAVKNKTWYGGDLVPTRLQDVPAEEQYDESIDSLSVAIGQATGISPYKINYVLDQYSGGIGDVFLPMMTPQAEGGNDDLASNLLAPLVNKFTVDSTMKNQSVSDLYELSDKLTVKANSSKATDEDILKNKFVDSVKTGMNELYKKKREIQSSDLPDSEKYEQVRNIQKQINYMAKAATRDYEDMDMRNNYADVGGIEYYKDNEGKWKKVDYENEGADLNEMNMSASEKNTYFKTKMEISEIVGDYKDSKDAITIDDEYSDEYKEAIESLSDEKKTRIIDTMLSTDLPDEQKAYLYGRYFSSEKTLEKITNAGVAFDDYLTFSKDTLSIETTEEKVEHLYNSDLSDNTKTVLYETSVLTGFDNEEKYKDYKAVKAAGIDINSWLSYKKQEFVADKDSSGKSISGSRKDKIINYVNRLNLSKAQKAIIIRTEYSSFKDYNAQIVQYLDSLQMPYDDFVKTLESLDMTVKGDMVYWD